MITYRMDRSVSDDQVRPLYEAVGWLRYLDTVTDFARLCQASQALVTAWDQDSCIGLARTVGDGQYVALIQDLLVLPDYQGQGVGTQLLTRILEASQSYPQVFLITDKHPQNQAICDWYQRRGLTEFESIQLTGFLA